MNAYPSLPGNNRPWHILRAVPAIWRALLASLIVAALPAAGEARHVDAVQVFQCAFGQDWDVNYDGWPDRWSRRTDREHPHYVNAAIQDDPRAASKKCLRIDLDGAAAAVYSPSIRVLPRFSYIFEAQLKNEGIDHSAVVLSLDFYDSRGRVLQTRRSRPFGTTNGWIPVRLEAMEPADPSIDRVTIGLHVERTNKGDLKGRVSLTDVRLARLPRIVVSTNSPANIYTELEDIVVRCELSGIPERDPEVRFQLFDAWKNELQSEAVQLKGQLIVDEAARAAAADGVGHGRDCFEGSAEWRPKITDYGYYRVVVQMLKSSAGGTASDTERKLASRTIYLAVVPPLPMPRRGEFGWTLPRGEGPLSFQDLSRLLPQVGVNWLKVPVWFDGEDPRRSDELIRFVELLGASNIEVVGIIDRPPASSEADDGTIRNTPIAELLSLDSSAWAPLLEPVMTRLSLRVRWWQLGREHDTSFVGFPALTKRIAELRRALFRFGQDVRLGLSWDWASANILADQSATWDFQQFCLDSPPAEEKFNELLAQPRENSALRWVFVEPPPHNGETGSMNASATDARSSEFVRRLVAAKVHGADAIIMPHPFDDENGLMRASGMPAELLLPWRTTAVMLAGSEYLGEMQLPAGSENRIFLRPDGQVVMVAWNDKPVQEIVYLGDDVRQLDILGRSATPDRQGREQVVNVGPTPSFILGLNEAVTRWQMAVSFEKLQVPSIFKIPHPNSIRFQNFFPQGVGGSLKIVVLQERGSGEQSNDEDAIVDGSVIPHDRWMIEPPQGNFQLAAGQTVEFPFDIRLKNALFGKQPVRVDFKIEADRQFEFSVYREMEVGTEDLTLEVNTHLEKDGTLIVEQLMTNSAERLTDLKCYLYAKGRRPERMQVYRLGPSVDRKVYRFPDGADLVGNEMLLEIEELNGPRVLRYRFVAGGQPSESKHENERLGRIDQADNADAEDRAVRLTDVHP